MPYLSALFKIPWLDAVPGVRACLSLTSLPSKLTRQPWRDSNCAKTPAMDTECASCKHRALSHQPVHASTSGVDRIAPLPHAQTTARKLEPATAQMATAPVRLALGEPTAALTSESGPVQTTATRKEHVRIPSAPASRDGVVPIAQSLTAPTTARSTEFVSSLIPPRFSLATSVAVTVDTPATTAPSVSDRVQHTVAMNVLSMVAVMVKPENVSANKATWARTARSETARWDICLEPTSTPHHGHRQTAQMTAHATDTASVTTLQAKRNPHDATVRASLALLAIPALLLLANTCRTRVSSNQCLTKKSTRKSTRISLTRSELGLPNDDRQ